MKNPALKAALDAGLDAAAPHVNIFGSGQPLGVDQFLQEGGSVASVLDKVSNVAGSLGAASLVVPGVGEIAGPALGAVAGLSKAGSEIAEQMGKGVSMLDVQQYL